MPYALTKQLIIQNAQMPINYLNCLAVKVSPRFVARFIVCKIKGTNNGNKFFIRLKIPFVSFRPPRTIWALIIRLASWVKIGINLKIIPTTIAT